MRRVLACLALAFLCLTALCGCDDTTADESRVEYASGVTGVTIVYNYSWSANGYGRVCNGFTIVTINTDGTIIASWD